MQETQVQFFWSVFFNPLGELLAEFLASVGSEDFREPRFFRSLVFAGEDFDNIKILEFVV